MKELWSIYHSSIPDFLVDFSNTKAMNRLKYIGMNCGVEYTSFPLFKNIKPYSRFDHSIGAALITWHFTNDISKSVASLLHDIASPVFAHTIDFLNGDHLNQESTEVLTEKIIKNDQEIKKLIHKYQLTYDKIINYHQYPIADNDIPKLAADRLEYSLGNMYNYGFCHLKDIKKFYDDLIIGINEDGIEELMFQDENIAIEFTNLVLKNGYVYVSNEDRFAMEYLALLIKKALDNQVINESDLYLDEPAIISKLKSNNETNKLWQQYQSYNQIITSKVKLDNYLKVKAKKRYIDPLVKNKRVSSRSPKTNKAINSFLNLSFDDYLLGHY